MNIKFRYFIVLLFMSFFVTKILNAQYNFSITVKLPPKFEHDTVNIEIDNILENLTIQKGVKKGVVILKGRMQTEFSSVHIFLENIPEWNITFYMSKKPVMIIYSIIESSLNPFTHCKIKNEYFNKISKRLQDSTMLTYNFYQKAFLDYKNGIESQKDSLKNVLIFKRKTYYNKTLDFLKINRNSYFSFDYFNSYFVKRASYSNADSLLTFFRSTFPKKYIQGNEGKAIESILISKKQIVEGTDAPLFEAKGINGNKVVLEKSNTLKYTLLQFWASWCAPCIKEMPSIKAIRNKYPEQNLQIISVSIDINSIKWKNAVKKHNLLWNNLNSIELSNKYGISSIPSIYLISPKGTIVYSSNQREDNDNLEKLSDLLLELLL